MEPKTGRIIHLVGVAVNKYETGTHCIAGIITHVTGNNMYVTAFPWHGTDASRRVMVKTADTNKWHDPRECPNDNKIDVTD